MIIKNFFTNLQTGIQPRMYVFAIKFLRKEFDFIALCVINFHFLSFLRDQLFEICYVVCPSHFLLRVRMLHIFFLGEENEEHVYCVRIITNRRDFNNVAKTCFIINKLKFKSLQNTLRLTFYLMWIENWQPNTVQVDFPSYQNVLLCFLRCLINVML